jgi:hypothetical protein
MALLGLGQQLAAQHLRLNGYGGYTFADKISFSGYGYDDAKLEDSPHYGFGLEVEVRPLTAVEIYYQWQPTTGRLLGALSSYETDVTVSYLMLGGLRYAGKEKVKGFGGLMVGAAFFNSEDVDATKLGVGLRGGVLISPNPKVGLRLGVQLLSVVQGASGGFYFGTGGSGAGVSTYSSIYQFGLFGGLSIGLGGQPAPRTGAAPRSGTPPPPPPPAR